ncbi:hypothetical protein JCM10908_001119 [Rhodotorula pacifica]|uniref:uncharacterized protein n=1 Tax=Rhodotorula pacifica TaxID=1495444 RepID=UPI00317D27E7
MHHIVLLAGLAAGLAANANAQVAPLHARAADHHFERRQTIAQSTASATVISTGVASATATGTATATATATGRTGGRGSVASKPLASLSLIGTATSAEATQPLPTTPAAGATPPVKGAPPLPNIATLNPANYPPLDKIPPLDSPEMKEWLSQIDFDNIPDVWSTGIGGCANATNAEAVKNGGEDGSCWWTCGGCTRATDITYCPNKDDWGASFDDGPSPYTPRLLNLLQQQNVQSTFFIVGSRAISRPAMVQAEYMLGHQLSVHTWAHSSLTTLSNEEIVAELGWTMKIIRDITGVTPNTFRPPYGDIDDRVRYIALQMGLRPIIWTVVNGQVFDTRDWQIAGNVVSATQAYNNFNSFLDHAVQTLPHGFIVLAHDLYQQSVDLAVDYVLPSVLNAGRLKVKTIASCLGQSLEDSYIETAETSNDSSSSDGDEEDEYPLVQTTSTVAGATGSGFVSKVGLVAATASSSSSASGSTSSSAGGAAQSDRPQQNAPTSSASHSSLVGSALVTLLAGVAVFTIHF